MSTRDTLSHGGVDEAQRVIVDQREIHGAIYSGRSLAQFVAINSKFDACDFSNMTILEATFGGGERQSVYTDCTFERSIISSPSPGNARFVRCIFRDVNFSSLNCRNVEFVDCLFSGHIAKGFFSGSANTADRSRARNDFYGNDFSGMEIGDVGFRGGIDMNLQKMPSGDKYIYIKDVRRFIEKATEFEVGSSSASMKSFGIIISMMERDLAKGQAQAFFNTEEFPEGFAEAFKEIRYISNMQATGAHRQN